MLVKAVCAAAMLLAPVSSAVPQTAPQTELGPIPKVVCRVSTGYIMGTAFRVGNGVFVTARHVINQGECSIEGQPVTILYKSPDSDYAILGDRRPGKFIPVDCDGYKTGNAYVALGHARGSDNLYAVDMIAVTLRYPGVPMSLLAGIFTAQPGMSGGPILDRETLKVVGMTNTGDWERGLTGSIQLKDTPICPR